MAKSELDHTVAVITGSSRGIGRSIARRFAHDGASVVVNYSRRDSEAASLVAAITRDGGEAIAVRADVSKSNDVQRLVRDTVGRFGKIDILVNNAGIHVPKGVFETTEDDWDQTLDVNLKGAYLCSKAVAPIMIERQAGRIINVSSNSGLYHPSAMRYVEYVASKAGLNGLTKALALALAPHITVNAICPGWIQTEMMGDEAGTRLASEILDETPLARLGTPEDVAGVAAFLASHDADFVTGELLLVAGGRGMH